MFNGIHMTLVFVNLTDCKIVEFNMALTKSLLSSELCELLYYIIWFKKDY